MSWVLLFDGDCAFCSRSVRLIAHFDALEKISFAPLQGGFSRQHGLTGYAAEKVGTLVLLRESDGKILTRSDALIQIARILGGWWCFFSLAVLIPRPLRDGVYRWIASNRYRFMGAYATCQLPDDALSKRIRD
jgi:predicted DCC family thiol-disulfide oxidoreductase YuxK